MKFFVDIDFKDYTKNFWELEKLAKTSLLAGVATNLHLEFSGCEIDTSNFKKAYQHTTTDYPVIAKCTSNNYAGMLNEGQELAKINQNIIVTVPFTRDGACACSALTKQEIKVNVTSCCSIAQALLAANAGATYISITADQLKNTNHNGISLIEDICDIYKKYEYGTQILLTSININNFQQVEQAARIGVHAVVIPYLEALFSE